jgi:hypothetical protein
MKHFTFKTFLYLFFVFSLVIIITNIDLVFNINSNQITDRQNYHYYITNGEELFKNSIYIDFPLYFFSEPLFKFVCYIFYYFKIIPELSIKIIIFFMLISTFWFLLYRTNINKFWTIAIILSPTIFVNYIMTIRQGFAAVLFLFLFYKNTFRFKNILIWLIPLFHYSFFIVNLIYFYSIRFKEKKNPYLTVLYFFLFSIFASILIFKLINSLNLSYFISYEDELKLHFGFGILYWCFILILFLLEGKRFLKKNLFQVLSITFYVGSVSFFTPFSRILQATSIFILLSGFELTGLRKQIFKFLLIFFIIYFFTPLFFNYNLGSMMLNY